MTGTFRGLLIGLALLVPCFPALGKDPRVKKPASDIELLQGTWLADLEPGLQGRLVLDGSELLYVHIDKRRETVIWDGNFAINDQSNPKQMDWTPLRKNNRNPPSSLAIYQLEGDLLLVIGNTEAARPTAFYSGGGNDRPKTVIFRRATKQSARDSKRKKPTEISSSE